MHKLKPLQVKNAKDGKHSDGGGLYFIKTKTSAKWIYRFSVSGKRREMGLGSYPEIGLADARRARDQWADLLRQGMRLMLCWISPVILAREGEAARHMKKFFLAFRKTQHLHAGG